MSEENLYSFDNPEYRRTYWHTCSHVLAQAVKRLYPEVKLAIGPSIENGFYYDLDSPFPFTQEHMDAIEPFDYSELKPFSNAYLPGFMANKYDVEAKECYERADERAGNTAADLMSQTVAGYSTLVSQGRQVRIRRGKVSYALLPVWMLSTRWNGENFLFAMNGQTGKLIGDLPVARSKVMGWYTGITAAVTALMALFLYFL